MNKIEILELGLILVIRIKIFFKYDFKAILREIIKGEIFSVEYMFVGNYKTVHSYLYYKSKRLS